MKIVVVGGVAGGMSAAARARRLDEHADIIVLERGPYVSFANCGLPYHLSGEITERQALLLHTPDSLDQVLGLDVRTGHEVTAIDPAARTVTVAHGADTYQLDYDALVLSPGAVPVTPPISGLDLPQVSTLRTVPDLDRLMELAMDARSAVVLGAGFIGLEAAEALRHRGLDVAVVELASHVLPPLDDELAALIRAELVRNGVAVHDGVAATSISPREGARGAAADLNASAVVVELSDGTVLPADLVVLSVGVRPDSGLAADAGLELTSTGAIVVDESGRTSDPAIWAVGDATASRDAITGQLRPVALAGPANRDGRRIADAIMGRATTRPPALSTAIVRVFDLTAATTGASQAALEAAGIEHRVVHTHGGHHAGYFPGASALHLKVMFAPDGALLGAQAVGKAGVDKRIDVIATALRAGMSVRDLAELELSYAPPYGSAKDPVNVAGMIASNVLDGIHQLWYPNQFDDIASTHLILDVRSAGEFAGGHFEGALNVPHTQVRQRLAEITTAAAGRPVAVHCAAGFRAYLAHRILAQHGVESVNLSGGMNTFQAARPDVELVSGSASVHLVRGSS